MKNPRYTLLLLSYGMNVGAFYAISTLLNQVVLKHFPVSTIVSSYFYAFVWLPVCDYLYMHTKKVFYIHDTQSLNLSFLSHSFVNLLMFHAFTS